MNQPKVDHRNMRPYAVTTQCGKYIVRQALNADHACERVDIEEHGLIAVSCRPVE